MKNYFVWRRFGFRTNKYYIYQDDERFYRYFKKQLYPPYKLMPMIMAGAGAAYIALFGYAGFGTLEKAFDRPVAQIFRSLADVAIYLFYPTDAPGFSSRLEGDPPQVQAGRPDGPSFPPLL